MVLYVIHKTPFWLWTKVNQKIIAKILGGKKYLTRPGVNMATIKHIFMIRRLSKSLSLGNKYLLKENGRKISGIQVI